MGSEHFLGQIIAKGLNKLNDKMEKDELRWPFPLIDPNKIDINKIVSYLGSEEFLGTGPWLWKEMRKKGK